MDIRVSCYIPLSSLECVCLYSAALYGMMLLCSGYASVVNVLAIEDY